MIESLYAKLLIPAFESGWHRRGTLGYLRELAANQWRTASELRNQQLDSLRNVIRHAEESCPYYQHEWAKLGLSTQNLGSLADFEEWPLVTRETIHEHRQQMRSTKPGLRLFKKATGGSSGVPLQFDVDYPSNERKMAAWHRGYGWAGAGLGTKQFYLWGAPTGNPSWRQRWKDGLYHRLYRRKVVNCFGLTDDRIDWFLAQLNQHRPDAIVAYTNPLYFFARALSERRLKPWQPRTIVVGAEKLHAFQRELIEQVFQAPVFETYGSREFMLIGAECPQHSGLHLTMENLLVEILDDDGRPTQAGHEGQVVITDLTNYGMPFVRYANGDRAIAGFTTCACGRGLPLLGRVMGRKLDTLRTPDGRMVPGEFFPHLLKDYSVIRRFQVIQKTPDEIDLNVVCNGNWIPGQRAALEEEILSTLGPYVRFRLQEVNDIPLTPAGKLRVVVSHCDNSELPAATI